MQLNSATTVKDYQWIYSGDDALARPDKAGEALDAFDSELAAALESGDMSRVPVKPGCKVAIWTLRHIEGLARDWVTNMLATVSDNPQQLIFVFRMCAAAALVSCDGVTDGNGREIEVVRIFDQKLGFEVVRIDIIDTLANFDGLLMALGAAVTEDLRPKKP